MDKGKTKDVLKKVKAIAQGAGGLAAIILAIFTAFGSKK